MILLIGQDPGLEKFKKRKDRELWKDRIAGFSLLGEMSSAG